MNADESLALAISEWKRKHHIGDADPLMALLELILLYLGHLPQTRRIDADSPPPAFEDFRGTIELLDRGSKSFIAQAAAVIEEMRRFAQAVERINNTQFLAFAAVAVLGIVAGFFIGRIV